MRYLLIAVATFAAVAVAACGGPAAAPTARSSTAAATSTPLGVATPTAGAVVPPPPAGDPAAVAAQLCAAASAADVSAVMHQAAGEEYGAGVPSEFVGQCTWRVGGATSNNGDGQLVAEFSPGTLAFIKSTFIGGVELNIDGHPAYWNPDEGLQALWTDVGDGRVLVLSFDPVTDTTETSAQVLARLFLSKI